VFIGVQQNFASCGYEAWRMLIVDPVVLGCG